MTAEPLILLVERLMKWRAKDDRLDRGNWHGVYAIANSLGWSTNKTRDLLIKANEQNLIERLDGSGGILWRGKNDRD